MVEPIRWGILGTGWIANEFAQGLKQLPDAQIVAVGSRTRGSAQRFAERHAVPHRHASYEALASDPDVDVIYVATPNPLHREHAVLCLGSGKPVLCEKPFALNAFGRRPVLDFDPVVGQPSLQRLQVLLGLAVGGGHHVVVHVRHFGQLLGARNGLRHTKKHHLRPH